MRKFGLLIRGAGPLLLVGLALIGGPALLAWWLLGGPFGWRHLLIGVLSGVALLAIGGLIFGWALGRQLRGRQ